MSLALCPFAAMSFAAGSAELSMAPAVRGTVYQAIQRAEDASDGKDAAFENLITKMAKVVDDLLKEKAVSSQRIIQLESQREEAERASQSREGALQDALNTQGKEIIELKKSLQTLTKNVAKFESSFIEHQHWGTGKGDNVGPLMRRDFTGYVGYASPRAYCQIQDRKFKRTQLYQF